MKSKLNYLVKTSLNKKIKNKWFKIVNIILAILIIGVINIDSIITFFGGDFNEKTTIYVVDNTGVCYDLFKQQIDESANLLKGTKSNYIIKKSTKTFDEAKKNLKSKKKLYLQFDYDDVNYLKVSLLSKEYIDLYDNTILNSAINNTKISIALLSSNIDQEQLSNIYKEVEVNRIFIDKDLNDTDENMETIMSTVFPIIILPVSFLILYLVQMIGAEINDEKTTRGMEIIISSVDSKTHFFSKVLSSNIFILLQALLLVAYFIIGLLVRKNVGISLDNGVIKQVIDVVGKIRDTNMFDNLSYILPLALVLLVLTFVAYSLLSGILASMTTNAEDFQQLQTPIALISLVAYYLSIMAGMFKGSFFIKVFSYIPLISAILSPSLLALGEIGIIDIIISILLLGLLIFVLIRYGLRIYKVGILNYSSKDLWKKMFKALKKTN